MDDPSAFVFSESKGVVAASTLPDSINLLPVISQSIEHRKPKPLTVQFKPKQPGQYMCLFKLRVSGGLEETTLTLKGYAPFSTFNTTDDRKKKELKL
jgi:hypothetical protein